MADFDIIKAIEHKDLFRPAFKDLSTWSAWITALKALFGLPMDDDELKLFKKCTGRSRVPAGPFRELWMVAGRRGGKSHIAAVLAVFLAIFFDYRKHLSLGERGVIMVIAANRKQGQVILNYIKGLLHSNPVFEKYIENEVKESMDLTNSVSIEVMSCSYRSVRGRTVLVALLDEVSFWRVDGANPDTEILAALRPSMASIPNSLLIAISSPYAKHGATYDTHAEYFGVDDEANVLVWQAATRTMNPTIPQAFIDAEVKKNPAAAKAEYFAEFREDIQNFLTREAVDACAVIPGVLAAEPYQTYFGFTDPSGGKRDQFTLAIGFKERSTGKLKTALIKGWKPPFNPSVVVAEIAEELKKYRISSVMGDRYAAEFTASAFRKEGITYNPCPKNKSELYLNAEGLINTGRLQFPAHKGLIRELITLERKTSRSGRDSVDHPRTGSDDLANAVCGMAFALMSMENSYFDGCDLSAEPVRVVSPNLFHGKTPVLVKHVVAGLTLPGNSSGALVIIALGTHEQEHTELAFVVYEYEDLDSTQLLKKAAEAKRKYDVKTIYARQDPFYELYNRNASDRGMLPVYLTEPPEVEGATGRIDFHIRAIKNRLQPVSKTLFFSKDSRLPGALADLTTEKAPTATDIKHTLVGALSYAVSALDMWRIDEDEEAEVDALNDSLAEMLGE